MDATGSPFAHGSNCVSPKTLTGVAAGLAFEILLGFFSIVVKRYVSWRVSRQNLHIATIVPETQKDGVLRNVKIMCPEMESARRCSSQE